MPSRNVLSPDYAVDEYMANNDTLHVLRMDHENPESRTFIEAFKLKDGTESPYYSFGWRTDMTVREATRFIVGADEVPGLVAIRGVVTACKDNGPVEYDWIAGSDKEEQGDEIVEIAEVVRGAGLVRLDISEGTPASIIWEERGEAELAGIGVITGEDINSAWMGEIFERTATLETKKVVERNLGALATTLGTFMQLPFGEWAVGASAHK